MGPLAAILAGTTLAVFLYGLYTTLFITSIFLQVRRHHGPDTRSLYLSMMFITSCLLFASVTATCILLTTRIFIGFVFWADGPAAYFADQSQPTLTGLNIVSLLAMLFNDSMMVYRLWIVYSRKKLVVIFPVLTFIGLVVSVILIVIENSKASNLALVISMTPWFVLTLCTNVYCTAFIAWKIWSGTKGAAIPVNGANLKDLVAMFVESSALITSWALFYAVAHQVADNSQYIGVAALPSIAGIANALLQTRIGLGQARNNTTVQSRSTIQFVVRGPGGLGGDGLGTRGEMHPDLEPKARGL
ncbi:hypothetical protein GGX14DRAFT_545148 [Mycena pura]|uniref:Uncharacterized protein n=1 Tax=Mycena pura TaxID=153505 RepID=A0AAD6V0G0_9AGAR|nr:hypothetical protein GGX14DRAFT_545148 [Mycena pura]